VHQAKLTSARDELIKEQGRLRRQLDKLCRRSRRSVSSSLHSLSESSSSSSSSVDFVVLDQGAVAAILTSILFCISIVRRLTR